MYIRVKVTAGSKKELVKRINKDHFEISVKEKAERNMANKKVREVLGDFFGVPEGKVRLISGHHSPAKIFDIDEIARG